MTTSRNITDQVRPVLDEIIDRLAQGDNIKWDIGIVLHPQQGMLHVIGLTLPGAVIGRLHQNAMVFPALGEVDPVALEQSLSEAIDQMRDGRSQELREGLAQAPSNGLVDGNGHSL